MPGKPALPKGVKLLGRVHHTRPFFLMPIPIRPVPVRFSCAFPVVVAGTFLLATNTFAQTTPAPTFALSTAPSRTQRVSVLLIALDEASGTFAPAGGLPLPGAPLTPDTAPPVADVPLTAVPLAPANWNPSEPPLGVRWSISLRKSRPKKPDTRFLPVPDPPSNLTTDGVFGGGKAASTPPAAGTTTSTFNTLPAPLDPPRLVAPVGRSLLAAISMRRALVGLGYANIEAVSPDSNLVMRALGDRRLASGTISTLKGALQNLASATALPEAGRADAIKTATQTAGDAASALGQATGYRAVVAVYVGPLADGKAPFSVVLSDSAREVGEPIVWDETAKDETSARETGAATGAALLDKSLRLWPAPSPSAAKTLADAHFARAKGAGEAGNLVLAQDEVTRVLTLDPSRADALLLLGDLLLPTDLSGAIGAYKRATQINGKDGESYARLAMALINAPNPDFPGVLKAGKQAIAGGADSAALRVAMARAEFGRADLLHRADRLDSAEDAEADAKTYLDRALELAPNDPNALKLMARALITSGRVAEGVQTLDRVAPLYPKDIDLQFQYARALLTLPKRREDAFVAYARVWKALGPRAANLDDLSAALLSQGFDQRVFALGKSGRQLSDGVAGGSIARETAFLQLARLKTDMADAGDAIAMLRPPSTSASGAAIARSFAASLMSQSLENQQTFLDTGQEQYRTRAGDLFRQAVAQLNVARTGGR